MITSKDFDRIVYPKPRLIDKKNKIEKIIGIDSEAYETGEPFIFGTSLGRYHLPNEIPHVFFTPDYIDANFVVYNIKYDSGALLYTLPHDNLFQLWSEGTTKHNLYTYKYIPHKLLRISIKINRPPYFRAVYFWDISQFYKMSLDKAAKIYLNDEKIDLPTKKFTPKYVKRFFKAIARYCIKDATLTARLGEFLVDKLDHFNIVASSLYSCASVSFKYFCSHSKVVTAYRLWYEDRELLKFACDAYEGGKFEVTTRGKFSGAEYDITSAYPYEIANLVDISNASSVRTPEYQPKAVYGFLRVKIDNNTPYHLPCGIMFNKENVRIYPAGQFYLTITKEEYEYLTNELHLSIEILDAYWIFVKRKRFPYRKSINTLFSIKSQYKGKDKMIYYTTKVIMNGFYGKFAQCIEMPNGKVQIGPGWNPVYASVITANTRIKVTRIQNLQKDDCLAVHTDSIITKSPIPSHYIHDELGSFEHVIDGSGILVACGMYQIADQCAFKGFRPRNNETWETILTRFHNRKKIPYSQVHVESWIETMSKNHPSSKINLFEKASKEIDLNCDVKRTWLNEVKARDLLSTQESSVHRIHIEKEPPKYWT